MLKFYILLCILVYTITYAYKPCPDGNKCPDGSTCCLMGAKKYGCCPMKNAVCCKDHTHCCPRGYICDISSSTCFHGGKDGGESNRVVAMLIRQPAIKVQPPSKEVADIQKKLSINVLYKIGNIMCPDKYSICPTGTTCCMLSSGRFGCCQYSNAVCCNDHVHCCPHNYVCKVPYCAPKQPYTELPMRKLKTFVRNPFIVVIYNICPDRKTNCAGDDTCCRSEDGKGFKCCPHRRGVCCEGGYCCPEGFSCNAVSKKCQKKMENMPMQVKIKAKFIEFVTVPRSLKRVIEKSNGLIQCPVPGETHFCPDTSTCCSDLSGTFSCCPIKNAICCASKIFCCPPNSCCGRHGCGTCSLQNDTVKETMLGVQKVPMKRYKTCGNGKYACEFGTNCCLLTNGDYKCCPTGSICYKGRCITLFLNRWNKQHIKGKAAYPILHRIRSRQVNDITCADNKTKCPDNNTCCNNIGTTFLCCPFTNAVCCKNQGHCCPKGYSCGPVGQGICNKDPDQGPEPNLKKNLADMTCPDNISQCADNSTCCKLKAGTYGCCPIVKAICCADRQHCCPPGYKCHTEKGYCFKGTKQIHATKYVVHVTKKNTQKFRCARGIHKCPIGNTCCKRANGAHSCCLFPKASCCADGGGCCPRGYTCSGDLCKKGDIEFPRMKYGRAVDDPPDVVCPDRKSKCKYGSTCCKNVDGGYGCCPLLEAVCCADKKHCCPHDFICNPKGYCSKGPERILASSQYEATQIQLPSLKIQCPDAETKCFYGETCCPLSNGTYGCCPLKDAVCCADEEHCCPHGYRCFIGYCSRGTERFPALKTLMPVKDITKMNKILCLDGKTKCGSAETCCLLSTGAYACCPLPNAVCCEDKLHCCPQGYKCDAGFCARGTERILASRHSNPLISERESKHARIFCPDKLSQCNKHETCCVLQTGGYGCCPLPKAVCCPDKQHCCPHGYKCSDGYCMSGHLRIAAFKHHAAIIINTSSNVMLQTSAVQQNEVIAKNASNIVCPDQKTVCDTGTCCRTDDEDYMCCQLTDAVCCDDDIHCCPTDFVCVAGGQCRKGNRLFSASKRYQSVKLPIVPVTHRKHSSELKKAPRFEELRITAKQSKTLSQRDKFLLSILQNKEHTCADGVSTCKQFETCCPTNEGYTCSAKGDCERFSATDNYIKFEPSDGEEKIEKMVETL